MVFQMQEHVERHPVFPFSCRRASEEFVLIAIMMYGPNGKECGQTFSDHHAGDMVSKPGNVENNEAGDRENRKCQQFCDNPNPLLPLGISQPMPQQQERKDGTEQNRLPSAHSGAHRFRITVPHTVFVMSQVIDLHGMQ